MSDTGTTESTQANGATTPKQSGIVRSERAKVLDRLTKYFALDECRALIQAAISDKSLTVERCAKAAIATVLRDDFLWACTSQSIFDCVLAATQLQLVVGKELGHAYLVPFNDKHSGEKVCTLILGYKGIVTLARRSGEIESIESRVVYDRELFEIEYGTNGHLRHVPIPFGARGKPVGVYLFARLRGGGTHVEPMSLDEVDAVKARSKASAAGPWVTDYLEMARKTVVKRGAKMLPLAADVAEAIGEDDEREFREARDVTPRRAALPSVESSGAVRIEKPEAGERVAAKIETADTEAPPHDPTTGEVLPTATPTVEPAPAKPARKPKADKPAEAPPAPAAATKPAVPSGAGLTDAVAICDELEAATEPEQVAIAEKRLAAHVAAGEMGSTSRARIDRAIEEAKKRIYGAAE